MKRLLIVAALIAPSYLSFAQQTVPPGAISTVAPPSATPPATSTGTQPYSAPFTSATDRILTPKQREELAEADRIQQQDPVKSIATYASVVHDSPSYDNGLRLTKYAQTLIDYMAGDILEVDTEGSPDYTLEQLNESADSAIGLLTRSVDRVPSGLATMALSQLLGIRGRAKEGVAVVRAHAAGFIGPGDREMWETLVLVEGRNFAEATEAAKSIDLPKVRNTWILKKLALAYSNAANATYKKSGGTETYSRFLDSGMKVQKRLVELSGSRAAYRYLTLTTSDATDSERDPVRKKQLQAEYERLRNGKD